MTHYPACRFANKQPMINRYTVIGQPVAHSLSPIVHQLFGELTQRKIHYTRTESTPDTFPDTVKGLRDSGARGCNITAPFKELASTVCDRLSPGATRAGSVNTIHMLRDGSMVGHNTDGPGLVADIVANKRRELAGRRVLILGAGGAVRGVMAPLLDTQPAALHIANRTASKADLLAEMFGDIGPTSSSGYAELSSEKPFDFIINATSSSLSGSMPVLPEQILGENTLAYDMTYAAGNTKFMLWAKEHDVDCVNGLGMLVEQAAESFLIWEGARPKTRLVYPRLHEILS